MSATGQNAHQLKLDIQHELITANQLLNAIKTEIQSMKDFTSPGGQLESMVKNSAASMSTLANIHQVDLSSIPPLTRHINTDITLTNPNMEQEQRNDTETDNNQMKLVY